MRAFVIEEFGKPGSVQDVDDPKPEAGELLVRVRVAGVNPMDGAVVNGYLADMMEHRFPLIPGGDLSGVVLEAPEGSGHAAGDEVYGATVRDYLGEGTWAELVRVAPGHVAPKPASIDHAGAAGIPTAGLTALEAVDTAGLDEGSTLVIVGATGGVGSYATQLAVFRGIRVIAVGNGENAAYARELGAAETIDYTAGDVGEQLLAAHPDGVDALFDTFSDTEGLLKLAPAVREGGVLLSPKAAADPDAVGATGRRGVNANRAGLDRLTEMNRLIEAGDLKIPETKTIPLEQANEAVAEISGGHVRGKLALIVD
jgi:NADPH:quinone reductase-like Zn-dependent oxidoreductase